jgi:hypothetical protein
LLESENASPALAAAEVERRVSALLLAALPLCEKALSSRFQRAEIEKEDRADADAAVLLHNAGYDAHAPLCAAHRVRELEDKGWFALGTWQFRQHPVPLFRALRALQTDAALSGSGQ